MIGFVTGINSLDEASTLAWNNKKLWLYQLPFIADYFIWTYYSILCQNVEQADNCIEVLQGNLPFKIIFSALTLLSFVATSFVVIKLLTAVTPSKKTYSNVGLWLAIEISAVALQLYYAPYLYGKIILKIVSIATLYVIPALIIHECSIIQACIHSIRALRTTFSALVGGLIFLGIFFFLLTIPELITRIFTINSLTLILLIAIKLSIAAGYLFLRTTLSTFYTTLYLQAKRGKV